MRIHNHNLPIGIAISLSVLFLLSSSNLVGQNNGIYKKLYYSIYLSNSGSTDFLENEKVHKTALKSLQNFYTAKSARSRNKAYSISRTIYSLSDKEEIKKQVIEDHLIACLNDRSPSLKFQLANHLIAFDKKYFSDEAVEMIKELIENDPYKKQYIVVAGYKNIDNVLPELASYSEETILESWDIVQALARVGKKEAIEICKKVIKEHPLDIKFFDKLLPGLIFTNHEEVFSGIVNEILDNNVELIGQRLKDYQRYYLLKHILPLIYEYPYRFVDESELTEDEFYHQLHFALDWLEENRETYSLIHRETPMRVKKNLYTSNELSTLNF
jgi:hypothetical protein